MDNNNYFETRNQQTYEKLREVRRELPTFCNEFFIGIETRTTPLTRLNYAYDLRIFFDFLLSELREFETLDINTFSLKDLDKVTTTHIEMFVDYISSYKFSGKKLSNSSKTKARKLASIRSFFKYFYNKDKLKADVASKVAMPKLHDKPILRLEIDEMVNLLNKVEEGFAEEENKHMQAYHNKTKQRDIALFTLFLGTGIRISECVGLNIDDFDFNVNGFKVTRKGGNQTILYFSDEVADVLKEYLNQRLEEDTQDRAMFLSMQKKRIGVRAVQKLVEKYASIVTPLKNITPHKLRSTYGTNLYRETNDIYVVAEVLGHKDINTTKKHYAAISDDIKRNAARSVVLREKSNDTKKPL